MDEKKIQEMQILEQNLQQIFMQKQSFEMELQETEAGLVEINSSKDDEAFKIVGQLMIKTDKAKMKEELVNKENILKMRLDSIAKQEGSLMEKLEGFRKEVIE
jgi:prefoldin beta subunit